MTVATADGAALVPFARGSSTGSDAEVLGRLAATTLALSRVVRTVLVVDDGSGIAFDRADLPGCTDLLRRHPNAGKAQAIRAGLAELTRRPDVGFVVQCDADLDQDPSDAALLVAAFRRLQRRHPDAPILVIGDRYPRFTFPLTAGAYRAEVLIASQLAVGLLGMRARDLGSGFRVYGTEFARGFAAMSRARGYGVEVEQLVHAYLAGAIVRSVILTWSRPRASSTGRLKILESLETIATHEERVRAHGRRGRLVAAWARLIRARLQGDSREHIGVGLTLPRAR